MIVTVLWVVITTMAVLQLSYGLYFFRHIWNIANRRDGIPHRAMVPEFASAPLSVVICAHNEGENLRQNLAKVLQLDYQWPDGSAAYELIVVNDNSTDETADVLADLSLRHPNLKTLTIGASDIRTYPGKKFPLSLGVAAASYDWIVCTDADCAPASKAWLHFMAAPLLQGKQIVAGYGGFYAEKGLLNRFIRYETLHTFLQYYSLNYAGSPYMAVGRNMAATKEMFLKASRHPAWSELPSGDDDLLVQACATADNMAVIAHPASFTLSPAKGSWDDYFRQKQRHVSTGKFYSLRSRLLLGGYALMHAAWWLMLIVCFMFRIPTGLLVIFMLPMAYWLIMMQQGATALRERSSIHGWLAFSFCWLVYNAVLAPYILWKTKQRWK